MLTITAIIAVHNGAKTIGPVLAHLYENDIDVYVIDHGSTDSTIDVIADYKEKKVKEVRYMAYDGVLRLQKILEMKEDIIRTLHDGWVIHIDADEIMDSPRKDETLRHMIERIDREGYDVIDCDEFIFVPMHPDDDEPKDYINAMRYYYYYKPKNFKLHRVQRVAGAKEKDWSQSSGHGLSLEGRKLAPEKICKRHYIGISFDHLRGQYISRVFDGKALLRGWHNVRTGLNPQSIVRPSVRALNNIDRDGLVTSRPYTYHLIFRRPFMEEFFRKCKKALALCRKSPTSLLKLIIYRKKIQKNLYGTINDQENSSTTISHERTPMPFIVGCGRSGTTLLRLLLDAHPDMAIPHETAWLKDILPVLVHSSFKTSVLRKKLLGSEQWCTMNISEGELDTVLAQHDATVPEETIRRIYKTYADKHSAVRYGDKTPAHSSHMITLFKLLPEARFIHIIRDGRDVAESYRRVWFGLQDIRQLAYLWVTRIRDIRQQAEYLPYYMEVRYEELVADPEKILRKIGEFIDLSYDPIQLEAYKHADERLSEVKDRVLDGKFISNEAFKQTHLLTMQPPTTSRIGKWKTELTSDEIATFERIAGDMLSDLGYERAT